MSIEDAKYWADEMRQRGRQQSLAEENARLVAENQRLRKQVSVLSETYQGSRELYELATEENKRLREALDLIRKHTIDVVSRKVAHQALQTKEASK